MRNQCGSLYKKIHSKGPAKVGQHTHHLVTYAPTKFDVAMSNGLGGDIYTAKYIVGPLTLGTKITQNIVKYPLKDET